MRKFLFIAFIFAYYPCLAQNQQAVDFERDFQYHIVQAQDPIIVDGKLDEATWASANVGTDFWQKVPYFGEAADPKTEIMLSYDDKNLYVAAKCFQPEPITITTLKRDVFWENDGIAIILDPLNTKNNALLFGTSAVGVQWDATFSPTSFVTSDWSNKWYVEAEERDEYWTAEFAIPFKILRYDPSQDSWGMNFVRNIQYANENHNWTAVPEGFWPPNPAFAGSLIWDKAPTKKSGNFNLIPYVSGGLVKNEESKTTFEYNGGLDAKVALSSTLNLDVTLNPDFSQIEADELVTNISRFNISLPEKRTFFLENADVFSDFGAPGVRPFFSRRIGLNEDLEAVPLLYGLRATGNINRDNRIGIMNIHSRSSVNSFAQNQTAVSYKRQFGRSFVQGLFLNRQAFEDTESIKNDYGRNLSLEGLYLSDDGKVQVWGAAHRSFKEGFSDKNMIYNTGFRYRNANWTLVSDFLSFEENFFADMGFTARVDNYDALRDTSIRVGFNINNTYIEYQKRPRKGKIQRHQFDIGNILILNPDFSFNESNTNLHYGMTFRNNSRLDSRLSYRGISLLFPFTFTDATPLPAEKYTDLSGEISFSSDSRKNFFWDVNAKYGSFYNGNITTFRGGINYRVQPWGNFSVGYQWNDLIFPDPYGSSRLTALVSKVEIGFNKNLLWTTLFQFVDQNDFMGINSRLQWRFSPMSDLFLVYLDNYDVIPGESSLLSTNRALILKLNYWY